MAFQARHRWAIQCIQTSLGFQDEGQVEDLLRGEANMARLAAFFRPDGPTKIFVIFQPKSQDDAVIEDPPPRRQLVIMDGLKEPLAERGVYFTKLPRDSSSEDKLEAKQEQDDSDDESETTREINPLVANDHCLTYGIVEPTVLLSVETTLDRLFQPVVTTSDDSEWGDATSSASSEFSRGLGGFVVDLKDNLKAMNSGLHLRKPDLQYDFNDTRNITRLSSDDAAVSHFSELVKEWCRHTESYLEDQDQTRFEGPDAGPATELEFWRRKLQKLMGITEQVKSKECKMVIGVLTIVSKFHDGSATKSAVIPLVRKWKQIDINITEAMNEAKDNVKYLATLERFIEPLYSGTIESVIDSLPALMNAIKMIHTIARYYNTTERMTKLFMKVTNQMIKLCKKSILGDEGPEAIWAKDPETLLGDLESCLTLNEAYQEQYRLTKDKLLTMPKGKQFDFSETQIFGKFDLFCRRVVKLIDMFSTIHQFRLLSTHPIEGMDPLLASFNTAIHSFQSNRHDLLDFTNNKFDRDFVEFNIQISDLEASLQHFINVSFDNITSIDQSLLLLKQFQSILQRENLRSELDSKFTVIFHTYGLELTNVQEIYEKYRHDPPIARTLPPVAGNILWSRHLLRRIEEPMRKFESNPAVLSTKESKKIIKTYNKVARTLVAFEYLWYEAWCQSIEASKAGLHATLIIRHPESRKLYVNFDKEILQLIREAKCLDRMGIDIPDNAKMVMFQEDKFKLYYQDLTYLLKEYDRISGKVIPVIQPLLQPHFEDLHTKLRPGMVTLTWTSMNIDSYKAQAHAGLQRLEELINNVCDIIENRIEKNLMIVSKATLMHLPSDQSFALDDFVRMQEKHVGQVTMQLGAKNIEIENAVNDVLSLVGEHSIETHADASGSCRSQVAGAFHDYYANLYYRSLINCTKQSLSALKTRVCSKAGTGFLFLDRPFFEVDVQLSVPSVRLSPSLDDIQKAINKSAVAVLRCSKNLFFWGQQHLPDDEKTSLFEKLGCDTEIIKMAILLTGALHGTKNQVHEYLATFKKYDWLWKEDMEFRYTQFMKRNPSIQDFECELQYFMRIETEIGTIAPVHNIAVLSLNTKNLKLQLRNECKQWKVQYSDRVHQQARTALWSLKEYIRLTTVKLSTKAESLDSLRFVMSILKEVRERESMIEIEISPIIDMYDMLEHYLPGGYMDKDEMDQKSVIRSSWRKLVDYAEEVTDGLSEVQGTFKKELMKDVKQLQVDVGEFRLDYTQNGPMVPGLEPKEAVARLKRFKEMATMRDRKVEMLSAGEELFGLRKTEYPDLARTKNEMQLLDQLYGLYMDVTAMTEELKDVLWQDVASELPRAVENFASLDKRCKSLPKKLREWEAFHVLRKDINEFLELLPLIQELSKEYLKHRHWEEVTKACECDLPFDSPTFKVQNVLDARLLRFREDIENICDSAQKQQQIEIKLKEISDKWASASFEFAAWHSGGAPVLKNYTSVVEELEESQMQLQSMLNMRHVLYFKDVVHSKLTQLSDTADVLELWLKVQMLWTSLESVFTSGDIAKQMPVEAKKFVKVDKDWLKLMAKGAETGFVVACCANESLRTTLPILLSELERCQKSLEGYLEQKRKKFPRFYFVSNPLLLQMLSRGSDPTSVQQYYEKIFDSIDQVMYDGGTGGSGRKILQIKSMHGSEEEVVSLVNPVSTDGNIEDWLGRLEKEMRFSVKVLCRQAAAECSTGPLKEFVTKHCGQIALLGVQLGWTADCQDALQKCKTTKGIMQQTSKKHGLVLSELSSWCLTDLNTKLMRTKVETLVTTQVHQRDCFLDLCKLYKDKKISDANDFEWVKQARFYWRTAPVVDQVGIDACVISICDVEFKYAFEYLGCKERLVITPLTDRAYITLTQALGMHLGGAPAGPAGTGKTETVKDLGQTLGTYVIVTNCTDQQRSADMAKIFKGLCQGGLWGCFDEFNRIELPVLSVVAQQVLAITSAKRSLSTSFFFPGDPQSISLRTDAAYFITMNPGYQGRQELPENLKELFRGVSMMVPDREIIIKVKLCAAGYDLFAELARKFKTLYAVCEQQLSKQRHYDFGLRNILSVLRAAGAIKRKNLMANEEVLIMATLRDMNLSKFVAPDVPIFLSVLKDIFPGVVACDASGDNAELRTAVVEYVERQSRVAVPSWITKVIQLHDTILVRHGIILVGPAGSSKSEIIRSLQGLLSVRTKTPHRQIRMNPKAIRPEEMFGETDRISGEWINGIFAAIWSKFNDRSRKDVNWIVCDGPVDAVWIENLNTVLDDNKILTLANGDRLPMADTCKLMFEVEDLRNASPATVSRAGIIFVSDTDLNWEPVGEKWIKGQSEGYQDVFRKHFQNLLGTCSKNDSGALFAFVGKQCYTVVPFSRVTITQSFLRLLTGLLRRYELSEDATEASDELERLCLFAVAWAVGGIIGAEDRVKLSTYLMGVSSQHPCGNDDGKTIFDYYLHPSTLEWEVWMIDDTNTSIKSYPGIAIPTKDTVRSMYLLDHLQSSMFPVLLVGEAGIGKSYLARWYCREKCATDTHTLKHITLSGMSTPGSLQQTIECGLEKRGGKSYGPPPGQNLTLFMDDLSLPTRNTWGDQPTLELARQVLETSSMCFLDKDKRGDFKAIENVRYISSMRLSDAGGSVIPDRLMRHFFTLHILPPTTEVTESICSRIISTHFASGENGCRKTVIDIMNRVATASVQLLFWLRNSMKQTPSKFHYIFTMRDLTAAIQSMLLPPISTIANEKVAVDLWRHEHERIFMDKLVQSEERKRLRDEVSVISETVLYKFGIKEKSGPGFFASFMAEPEVDEDGDIISEPPKEYEYVKYLSSIQKRCNAVLDEYNRENPARALPLILFDEAVLHLVRISRVLSMTKGHMVLVGVGGSGKRSLVRLASIITGSELFQIATSKTYNVSAFMDDLRQVFKSAGQMGKAVSFLLSDEDVKEERFLELLNSFLGTGEIPGLFTRDELAAMASELRSMMHKEHPERPDTTENLVAYYNARVQSNLHFQLCMSPVGDTLSKRYRDFPHLFNACAINWFLPWPEEALADVSRGRLADLNLEATSGVKDNLISLMGNVHGCVVETCDEYFTRTRRRIYQTPRSFLHFLSCYKSLYEQKKSVIERNENSIKVGLQKLVQAAKDVEVMGVSLKEDEVKLAVAESNANRMLEGLQVKSLEAKKESDVVEKIKEECMADSARILKEKEAAEEDLQKAKPFLEEAERAVNSIKPNDLNELKKLAKPGDIIKLIFDCVSILQKCPLAKVDRSIVTLGIGKDKRTIDFVADSYGIVKSGMLADTRFLQNILFFSKHEKDNINEETMELLMPYMQLEGYTAPVARNASRAAEGLFCWVTAMTMYHEASKVVKPKLEALNIAEGKFEAAQANLRSSEEKLEACQSVLSKLQNDFQTQMAEKAQVEADALRTKRKMEQANSLISGLDGERCRWTEDCDRFAELKVHLIGDSVLASAFLIYCASFDYGYRTVLLDKRLPLAIVNKSIPKSQEFNLEEFMVDSATVSSWSLEGLPSDPLSIQNGILVTKGERFPLLIDPQGQALSWIVNREKERLPSAGVISIHNSKLKESVEYCVNEGLTLVLDDVEDNVDPILDNLLDKNIIVRSKSKFVNILDRSCEYNDAFKLLLVSRLANPALGPELQARVTVVDFTVTPKGLEEQLLAKVIQHEQKSLEEQLVRVQTELRNNKRALLDLDALLLERLSSNSSNLLEDTELISVLESTKSKALEVKEKISSAQETKKGIDEKREQYRPVATRGALLYFCILEFSAVNSMYQTSLAQFLQLYSRAIEESERATLSLKRVGNIIEVLTYIVYRYINRGLYERDRLTFLLSMALKLLVNAKCISSTDITLLMNAGKGSKTAREHPKPFTWLSNEVWANMVHLSREKEQFASLPTVVERNEQSWRQWLDENEPEKLPIPEYESVLFDSRSITASLRFHRLLLVRYLREDRTIAVVNGFLRSLDSIDYTTTAGTVKLPALGPQYAAPVVDTLEKLYGDMQAELPVLFLLSPGSDPTEPIEALARKKRQALQCISMGEGQEVVAAKALSNAKLNGTWLLLQNCHLGIDYMEQLGDFKSVVSDGAASEFRLFLTSDPHPAFPTSLLHATIKVTNEPPSGIRAGLLRSCSLIVDQDKLDRVESSQWRRMVFALCFIHSVVQERRKFGPLGFNVPYEFNLSDLNASLVFMEKHLFANELSWPTIQFMIAEVHYGGRITDEMDRRLFSAYCELWLNSTILSKSFSFIVDTSPSGGSESTFSYSVPDITDYDDLQQYVSTFPTNDPPELFGLHQNAELSYRVKKASSLLHTIAMTQSWDSEAVGNEARDQAAQKKVMQLQEAMPESICFDQCVESLKKKPGGVQAPLNVFLLQEVQSLQHVINVVQHSLSEVEKALMNEVTLTSTIRAHIDAFYDETVPRSWVYSSAGDEISWHSSSLGLWFTGLNDRVLQLRNWIDRGKPHSFWLTGLFNSQGFLTAVRQEVTKQHASDHWALDDVTYYSEVTDYEKLEQIKQSPKEGVLIHGLFIEGASWSRVDGTIVEADPKKLYVPLPVVYVTATTLAQAKTRCSDYGPYGGYEAPCYKYAVRTDRHYIFSVTLATRDHRPLHWTLRGVALLCNTPNS